MCYQLWTIVSIYDVLHLHKGWLRAQLIKTSKDFPICWWHCSPHATLHLVGRKATLKQYRYGNRIIVSSMKNLHFKVAYYLFHFICTSATIAFICFCLYKYSLNDDVSQVTFQEFHKEKDNLYPSLTICTSYIFFNESFKSYG